MNQIIEVRTGFELNLCEKAKIQKIAAAVESTVEYVVKPGRKLSYLVSHTHDFKSAGLDEMPEPCISDNRIQFALKETVSAIENVLDEAVSIRS